MVLTEVDLIIQVRQLYTMLIPFILISALKYTNSLLALKYIVSALSSCNRAS